MKKQLKGLLLCIMLLLVCLAMTSCKNAKYKGKYNLVSVEGFPGVTASTYTYNYIELKLGNKYYLENSVNGTITSQSGTYSINSTETAITFTSPSGSVETYELNKNKIIIKSTVNILETVYCVTFIFEK